MAKAKALPFTVQRTSPVCVRMTFDKVAPNNEQWVLVTADRHWDSPSSNHAKQIEHLKEAKERGAAVWDFGDLFCLMQLPGDKRAVPHGKREEHNRPNYLDQVVSDATEFFRPYAANIAILGQGNHETAVQKYTTSNLTDRLASGLRAAGSPAIACGYRGYIRCVFNRTSTQRQHTIVYWSHGSGGGAPVTQGVIQTNRRAVMVPDADLVFSGHIHRTWTVGIPRYRLGDTGIETADEQVHCCIPTYKEAQANKDGGWEHERELMPWAQGAVWLRFYVKSDTLRFDITRAQ